MNLKLTLVMAVYVLVALIMCAFILANEDAESLGNPSPISVVRSTQKGSIIEYIIWSFATLFFITCITLNRLRNSESLSKVLTQITANESKSKSEQKQSADSDNANVANSVDYDTDSEQVSTLSQANESGSDDLDNAIDDELFNDLGNLKDVE